MFLSGIGSPGKDVLNYQIQQGVLTRDELSVLLRDDKNTRFLYDYDPLATIRQIRQPVLIIHGNKDRYVPYTDVYKLEKALRLNGNHNVTVHVLEGYNGTFLKEDPKGRMLSARILEEVLTMIANWLAKEI